VWGSDLSGSIQGAGGVGGLLESSYHGTSTTNCFAAYDGNGNVMALVNAADGTISAEYDYAPFGEVLRQSGPMAKVNPFRWSTKYQDDESDLVYYGLRYLKTSTGRWLSRDPIEEEGDDNLYAFVRNSATSAVDGLGQITIDNANRLITLTNCEIAILYGHGSSSKKRHWKWKYANGACAAGTAIMCFPANNADGLLESMNLWTAWGGVSVEEADWEKVWWGMSPTAGDWFLPFGDPMAKMPNANKVLVVTGLVAIKRAYQFCTACSCKSVHIYYIEVDHKSNVMNPKKEYDGVPAWPDQEIPCDWCNKKDTHR